MKVESGRLKKAAPWFLGGLTGTFLLANLAASAYFNYTFLRPKRKKNQSSDLTGYIPEAEYTTHPFRFRSSDGIQISALRLEPARPNGHAVLVCHGLAHDKYSGIRYVQYLLREGYLLVLIDFRNHGESEGTITTYGHYEKQDLLATVRYLREGGFQGRIGILGASMGASIALMTAAECEEIRAIILDSPFSSLTRISTEWACKMTRCPEAVLQFSIRLAYCWLYVAYRFWVPEVEPAAIAKKLRCPIFLIHGGADEKIPPHHSREIYENVPGEKELWIADNVGHLGVYLNHAREYETRVLQFFHKNLLT
ncbi:alpha/beta fold hydrolase [bacterium]|nr:alpha/beta fold hydrolase [bacterium]MCI0605060.1 alpha/beta fold hydrolase [bacterium]